MVKILLFESIILDEIFKCMQPMLSTMNTSCLVMQGNLLLCVIVTKLKQIFFLFWEAYVAFQSVSKSGCTNLPRIRIPRPGDPFLPFEDVSIVIKIDINKK